MSAPEQDLYEKLNAMFKQPHLPEKEAKGSPMSIRLTRGAAQKLRAITGRPAGEVIRTMVDAYIERTKLENARAERNR